MNSDALWNYFDPLLLYPLLLSWCKICLEDYDCKTMAFSVGHDQCKIWPWPAQTFPPLIWPPLSKPDLAFPSRSWYYQQSTSKWPISDISHHGGNLGQAIAGCSYVHNLAFFLSISVSSNMFICSSGIGQGLWICVEAIWKGRKELESLIYNIHNRLLPFMSWAFNQYSTPLSLIIKIDPG